MLYIFSNCKHTIRTLPLLMYDEHKPEDLDSDGEDHIADTIRYLCMSRPIKPRIAPPPDKYKDTPMAKYLDIPKEDLVPKPRMQRMEVIR